MAFESKIKTIEWVDNLSRMIEYAKYSPDFIKNSYNEFERIQDRNKSNKGSQRQLKITFDKMDILEIIKNY